MKKTEIILAIIAILGFIANLYFIPGGAFFFTLGIVLLAVIYFIFGFAIFNKVKNIFKKESYFGIRPINIIFSVILGIIFSSLTIGILFGCLNYPGANVMLMSSLCLSSLAGLILFVDYIITKSRLWKNCIIRLLILGLISLVLFLTPRNTFDNFKFRNYPDYLVALNALENDPNNIELQQKLAREKAIMERKRLRED